MVFLNNVAQILWLIHLDQKDTKRT